MSLVHQRCFNHAVREAVVRCPECRRFFCRECAVEHSGRMLCAGCLQAHARIRTERTRRFTGVLLAGQFVLAFAVLWFLFYMIGTLLIHLPSSFHEQTLWNRH